MYGFIVFRLLDIRIENSDKLPTSVCQTCVSKVEELDNFYNHCQNAQETMAVQYEVQIQEHVDDQSLMMPSAHSSLMNVELGVKENLTEELPGSATTTTLSADKLLETAIKDTCILSEEESDDDEDDSSEVSTDGEESQQVRGSFKGFKK